MIHRLQAALHALRQGLNPAVDEAQAARLRAAQLAAIVRLTPISVIANLIDGGIVVGVFWNDGPQAFLAGWGLAILVIAWGNMRAWQRSRNRPPPRKASEHALRRATLNAVILGLVWALAPIALFPGADAAKQILIMTLTVGLITADVYVLSTVPRAAIAHCGVMAFGVVAALALTGEPVHLALAAIIVAYTATVVISALLHGSMVTQHFLARDKVAQQSQLIGLLLRDFEESASDWLWEIDAKGNLQHVPLRFAEVSGRPAEALQGANLLEFLQQAPAGATVAADALFGLRRHLAERTPFRDLTVRVAVGNELRWWSLTGKPVFDDSGTFTGYRGVGRDVTAARSAEERILYLARHDALTGLPNRTLFRDNLASALERIKQDGRSLAVICLDLDHFKSINETMGHPTGDKLLGIMAQRLSDCAGENDLVARLSGDEFAILQIAGEQPESAAELAQRLISAVEAPMDIGSAQITLTTSLGIAVAPRDGDDGEALLKNAELALYRAKADGRGTYRVFEPAMDALTEARHRLELDLRRALKNDEFRLHFQPIVDINSKIITGFEALLRWQHPERGLLSPAEFIPVAEETGLIIPIGEWVLRRACNEASKWPEHIRIAVNLSPIQFRSPNLVPVIVNTLATSGLIPERLELEITESLLLEESELSLATMQRLRSLGAGFSLDDFGTGFSSLGYLRRFPFDKIKIDKSFVQEMTNRECLAIVRTIANLAGNLGMRTTAEGIETPEQLDRLRTEGCNEGQGYLFGRPQPAEEVAKLIAQAELRPIMAA